MIRECPAAAAAPSSRTWGGGPPIEGRRHHASHAFSVQKYTTPLLLSILCTAAAYLAALKCLVALLCLRYQNVRKPFENILAAGSVFK